MSEKAITNKNIKIAFVLVSSLFLLWGVSYGLVDVMNKNFQNQLGITKGLSGLVQLAYFGGYILIAIPASIVSTKRGYKGGIIMGLFLYAVGALLIIPASNIHSFAFFLFAFFVIACGLGSIETSANPYITKLGKNETSAFRLNVAQTLNGLGQFIGPILGGTLFLSITKSSDIAQNMYNVQMVYVGIALVVFSMLVVFLFTRMPEGAEVSGDEDQAVGTGSFKELLNYRHFRLGVIAQCLYMAIQVGEGAFFINYSVEHWQGLADHEAAYFFSAGLVAFLIGRVVTTPLMKKISPNKLLATYSGINCILMIVLQFLHGLPAVICLIFSFFLMSISFPTIFALSLVHLPQNFIKRASALLIMSIGGGAFMPTIMGHIADVTSTGFSFLCGIPCYLFITWYGIKGCIPQVQPIEIIPEIKRTNLMAENKIND